MRRQTCPLCGNGASFDITHNPEGKRFTCQHCSDFWIDGGSERHLENLPEVTRTERKQKLSKMAKTATDGKLLVIREPSYDEARTGIKNQTKTMIAEYISI